MQQLSYRLLVRTLAVAAMVVATSAIHTTAAHAHAVLVKSEPGRRAVIAKPPGQVRLWFNEALESAYSTVVVSGENGKPVASDPAAVDKIDPKLITLKLPALKAGTYTVRYRVLSIDGHVVDSGFTFTVRDRSAARK